VTLAYLCEGSYQESRPYADFMGYTAPWYSARDAGAGLLAGRGFGWLGCYVRDDDDRGYETMLWLVATLCEVPSSTGSGELTAAAARPMLKAERAASGENPGPPLRFLAREADRSPE
jgi:hypothetical protein